MKIKKIVINGFKSFGEKTEIEFDENLIGIVGPNGSGKSNIIDAVRWVLGQQKSAELRTKSNTDVIFSGSDNKAPKNVAEVTIVFDNEDRYLDIEFQEVAIKRRLYRSGDSEYYINNTKCRLIDINNLILDKGFGKDSYSIISQGKVEEIIMAKPDKRRELIDEVAGISKYKYKKKITLNKLKSLNENLDKIEFILGEIIERIEPLEREKEKAIKYKEIKEVLEVDEKALFVNKINKNNDEINKLTDNLVKVTKEISEENNVILEVEKIIKECDTTILDGQTQISNFNVRINELENKKIVINNEINLISQKKELHKTNNQQDIIKNIRAKLNNLVKEEEEIKFKKVELEPALLELENKLKEIKEQYYVNQSSLYELKNKYEDIKSKDKTNKNPYHIQKLLDLQKPEVLGTVRENLEIYSKYEIAINTILGNRRNEIIVENEFIIKNLIEYLKVNKLGKATFSPITKVKPKFIDRETKTLIDNSNIKVLVAKECVRYNNKYEKVIDSLLGNVLIVDKVEDGQKLNNTLNSRYQIVTIDGDVLYTSGKVSGGYDKNNKNFGKDSLENVNVKVRDLESIREKQNQEIENISFEVSEKKIQLELINNKLEDISKERKSLEFEYNMLVEESGDGDLTSIQDLEKEVFKLSEEIYSFQRKKGELENLIKISIEKKEEKNQEIVNVNANFKMLIKEETEDKMRIERLKDECKILIDDLREKYNITFQKAHETSIKIHDLVEHERKVKELKRQIKELGFVNVDAIDEYKEQKERLDFYSENKDDLLNSKKKIEDAIQKIDVFVVSIFKETFIKLNAEFKVIFEQLFEGGTALLKLTDEGDLLNTGVEIIAKPPGKKSQIIGLLSGGEKALTAISLLFAILKIRVVPFSILDEVEAALDEANVIKYIEYLKIFSQKTQFILITHRQTTMEKIDKLYGVTMIDKGISSVIDIKLEEGESDV